MPFTGKKLAPKPKAMPVQKVPDAENIAAGLKAQALHFLETRKARSDVQRALAIEGIRRGLGPGRPMPLQRSLSDCTIH